MRAVEIFDTDEQGKLGGSLAEILQLADPPASRLHWTLRYIEARDDVSEVWPAGLKDLEAQASSRKFGLELTWTQLTALAEGAARAGGRAPRRMGAPAAKPARPRASCGCASRCSTPPCSGWRRRQRAVLTALERRFKDTRVVELSEMY